MTAHLAILVACAHEAALIRAQLQLKPHTAAAVGNLWHGALATSEVLLLQCGMGPHRAAQAVRWLAEHYPLSGILSAGFAGGLHLELATGQGVLVTTVLDGSRTAESSPPLTPITPDARLTHIATMALAQAALRGHAGTLLSTSEVVAQATAKQQLRQQTGACAVDMESFSIWQTAQQMQVPFAVLRVIFDPATDDFPFPVRHCLTPEGDLLAGRLSAYLVQHPRSVCHLLQWWRQSCSAGRCLQDWVKHFFILLDRGA